MRQPAALLRHAPLGAFVAVSVLLAFAVHRDGHYWGDDFALYIRQSKGLVEGNWAQVIADTHFAVDNSAWHTFSPYVYPWGFPLLLAPFYWMWGMDYEHLKWLGVISFAVFLVCFNRITERRIGYGAALALTAAIGCSLPFLGQTNTVQSEMPFLAFAAISLLVIDHLGERGAWEGPRPPLIWLGCLLAFTFNIRREGLALVVALGAVHLAHLARTKRGQAWWRHTAWKRLATPYLTFAVAVVTFQIVLPSVVAPDYPGTGFHNLGENFRFFRREFAAQIGFVRPYRPEYEVLGSVGLGRFLFWGVVLLLALGLAVRLVRHWRDDAALLGYVVALVAVTGRLPFHEGRYLLQLTPFLLYFAAQALPSAFRIIREAMTPRQHHPAMDEGDREPRAAGEHRALRPLPERIVTGVVVIGLAGIALLGFSAARGEADRTSAGDASGVPQWGPTDPNVVEMWAAVDEYTRADDVVAFFRSRAMMLATDRRSIQSGGLDTILAAADFYAMEKGSSYSQPDVSDQEAAQVGMEKVWENSKFVLWKIPE